MDFKEKLKSYQEYVNKNLEKTLKKHECQEKILNQS